MIMNRFKAGDQVRCCNSFGCVNST
ncbi:hypothetical protein APK77_20 [Acinetobacter phage APK77]|uniref:Uncharacterized protein n=1 Tax=Acinetobacter phage APK77 TaxID=2873389 RepID=A0AAE9BRC4_9CAUD|nr:hypothetical protein APK77_20 [Acinetobacter phage APK77]